MRITNLRTRWLSALAAIVAVLALAGCNGDADEPTAEDSPDVAAGDPTPGATEGPTEDEAEENPCAEGAEAPDEPFGPPAQEGATPIEAVGVDYAFEGLEDSYGPGTYALSFRNDGEELHEIGIMRIAEGEDRPVEELLALPEEESQDVAEFLNGTFACPGQEGPTAGLELEAGRYVALCFIPVGTTPETTEFAEEGEPHYERGMLHEFTVG